MGLAFDLRSMRTKDLAIAADAVTDNEGYVTFKNVADGYYKIGESTSAAAWRTEIGIDSEKPADQTFEWTVTQANAMLIRSAKGQLFGPGFYPSRTQRPYPLKLIDVTGARPVRESRTDSQGRFTFGEDGPSGRYYLEVEDYDMHGFGGRVLVEVRPNAQDEELDLDIAISDCGMTSSQRTGREPDTVSVICGRARDFQGHPISSHYTRGWTDPAHVYLYKGDDGSQSIADGRLEDGKFRLENQPAGTYQLVVTSPDFGQAPFERLIRVEAGGDAECVVPIVATLRQMYQ